MSIVGITGKISSGKDTVADYLCDFYGFKRMGFADALKDAVSVIFSWNRELLDGRTEESRAWREQIDVWWANRLSIPHLTPRWILTQWGTEVVRKNFHEDIWVAAIENKLRTNPNNIVITDCRYLNEIETIHNAGGKTIRVHRGGTYDWEIIAKQFNNAIDPHEKVRLQSILENEFEVHSSEYSSVGLDYDVHIDNSGSLQDLYSQIKVALKL